MITCVRTHIQNHLSRPQSLIWGKPCHFILFFYYYLSNNFEMINSFKKGQSSHVKEFLVTLWFGVTSSPILHIPYVQPCDSVDHGRLVGYLCGALNRVLPRYTEYCAIGARCVKFYLCVQLNIIIRVNCIANNIAMYITHNSQ